MSASAGSVRGWRGRGLAVHALCATLLCAVALAALSVPAPARADIFGEISLVSAGTVGAGAPQQAEYAHDAAISGNGRYVAFDGSVAGVTGVWRRDVATGAIEKVAGGDAELPSVSESGRYISFTSTEELVPEDETKGPNVWVRDMEPGAGEPAYILASAVSGSTKGLTYEYGSNPAHEEQQYGSVAVGRSALSADGHEVAFVTSAVSNLVRYPQREKEEEEKGEVPRPHTPALQAAVRYLDTHTTLLVSRCYECTNTSEPVSAEANGKAFGAVYPGSASGLEFRPPPVDGNWAQDPPPGPSISADGSTVAWMGEDIGEQARMLPREVPLPLYTEPLWRRIAPGSETPTERVTGGSDPANPTCVASGEAVLPLPEHQTSADPCQGPFEVEVEQGGGNGSIGIWPQGEGDFVPRLSGDGYTVAFISRALPISFGLGFGNSGREGEGDLYVADMHPGRTRDQALSQLTELAGEDVAASDPITDFDISPYGGQVAFTTRRTEFPLGSPAYVSAPATEAGESELFDVDLGNDTLTRVTHGFGGEASEQKHTSKLECPEDVYCGIRTIGAQSPSFSADGRLVAFSSTASNLVYGDGNSPSNPFGSPEGPLDGSDAFLVERQVFVAHPTPQYISPAPQTQTEPAWQLGASALSRPDGSVLLYVEVPGAGTLRAVARGAVRVKSTARSAAGARARARRARRGGHARETVATRNLASSSKLIGAGGGELAALALRLAKPYAALASQRGGLSAAVALAFTASGHAALHQSIEVMFLRTIHPPRSSGKGHAATHRRRSRR